jgi:hypothetical protein
LQKRFEEKRVRKERKHAKSGTSQPPGGQGDVAFNRRPADLSPAATSKDGHAQWNRSTANPQSIHPIVMVAIDRF